MVPSPARTSRRVGGGLPLPTSNTCEVDAAARKSKSPNPAASFLPPVGTNSTRGLITSEESFQQCWPASSCCTSTPCSSATSFAYAMSGWAIAPRALAEARKRFPKSSRPMSPSLLMSNPTGARGAPIVVPLRVLLHVQQQHLRAAVPAVHLHLAESSPSPRGRQSTSSRSSATAAMEARTCVS